MARKSAEALVVVSRLPGQRPEPPTKLPKGQAEIWRSVVATKPHDWFTADTLYLLEAYCGAVLAYRLVTLTVASYTQSKIEEDPKGYDVLTKLQERQAHLMASTATKLRLTPQSRYTEKTAGTAAKRAVGERPWDAR